MKLFFQAAAICMLANLTHAQAAPLTVVLPPETAALKSSTLPGYAIARQQCMICHSADYIQFQPPAMTLAQWTAEATKMQHLYGAPLSDQDVRMVGAYLAVAYGNVKENELSPELHNMKTAQAEVADGAIDTHALLSTNGCLGCHAIDKKIVGPAYHDVATKYRTDAAALAKLQESILHGSKGKWGMVDMPPFPQLKPAEIKALAEFVLQQ